MGNYDLFISLAVALGVGLLIGLEREQSSDDAPLAFLGGARTHPLFAMAGALSVLLSKQTGAWLVAAVFVGLMAFVVLSYVNDLRQGRGAGATSEAAFAVSFLGNLVNVSRPPLG